MSFVCLIKSEKRTKWDPQSSGSITRAIALSMSGKGISVKRVLFESNFRP